MNAWKLCGSSAASMMMSSGDDVRWDDVKWYDVKGGTDG